MSEDSNFCLYYKNEGIQIGWIQEFGKKKLRLLNKTGDQLQISPKQCFYFWKDEVKGGKEEVLCRLEETDNKIRDISENFDLAEVCELCESGESYSLQELCGFFFNPPWSFFEEAGLMIALKKNELYFREKNGVYTARSEDEIQRLKKELGRRQEQETKQRQESEWAETILSGQAPNPLEEDAEKFEQFIKRTYHFAIHLEHHPESEYLAKIWKLRISDAFIARNILAKALRTLNKKVSWGCLLTKSAPHGKSLSPEVFQEIEHLRNLPEDSWEPERVDETHLEAFTIDSKETEDYDDAVSLEITETGYRIRVHIADVASRIPIDSELFHLARSRITSLYTPKGAFHMFPREISVDLFSLTSGKTRPVLTFLWETDKDFNAETPRVYASVIRCRENSTYEEADQKVEAGDETLNILQAFCKKQLSERIKNGALVTASKDLKLKIDDPENIQVILLSRDTPSNLIISELAIQTNRVAGEICRDHNLGGIYRVQEPYQLTKEFPQGEPVDMNYVIIKSARMLTEPAPHCGLGLDVYMQVTSPIRRFADLVGQHLLSAWLQNRVSSFRSGVFLVWSQACEEGAKICSGIEKELEFHWKLKYLAQNREKEFEASFVRYIRHGFALIKIDEIDLFKEVEFNGFYEGCRFKVKIEAIDPELHYFKLKPIPEVSESSIAETNENA